MTARHSVDHALIPEPDPTFIRTLDAPPRAVPAGGITTDAAVRLAARQGWTDPARDVAEALEHNERAFLYGPSGTGKSSLVRQIAAIVRRPVRRVSLNGETSVADFIGHWTVNAARETVFGKRPADPILIL